MASYLIPGQNLSYNIPDEGVVYRGDKGQGAQNYLFVRKGTVIYRIPADQYTGDVNNLPPLNWTGEMADAMARLGNYSTTAQVFQTADNDSFTSYIGAPATQTNYTQSTSPDNPQGVVITGSDGQVVQQSPSVEQALLNGGATIQQAGTLGSIERENGTGVPVSGAQAQMSGVQTNQAGIITTPIPGQTVSPTGTLPSQGIDPATGLPLVNPNYGQATGQVGSPPPTPPTQTTITNPVTTPSTITPPPTLPTPTTTTVQNAYFDSLTQQLAQAQAAFDAENAKRTADYQKEIDANQKKLDDFDVLQAEGMADNLSAVQASTAAKNEALALEKQRFDENYNANQALIGEMNTLLTEGNTLIKQQMETTGLASIRNPRINQTLSDIAARAGVIQALLSARNGQMSQAQNQLSSTLNAVTSILNDQTEYYRTLLTYYESLKSETGATLSVLKKDQKVYLDAKLIQLENDLNQVKANAQNLSNAMTDPDTALTYAQAGVSLTDSPGTVAQKLAQYAYSQEVKDMSNEMAVNGYSTIPIPGVSPVTITDSRGVQKYWYKKDAQGGFTLTAGETRFDEQGNVIASVADNGVMGGTNSVSNPDIQKIVSDPSVSQSGNYARVANGSIVDLTTGQVVNSGTTSTQTPTAGTKGTVTSGTYTYTPADIQEVKDFMLSTTITDAQGNPNRGPDGYMNPRVYLDTLDAWIAAGGLKADFLKVFPINTYIKKENTWPEIIALGGGTKAPATNPTGGGTYQPA